MISLDTAACRNADPELFHPAPNDHQTINVARTVCARAVRSGSTVSRSPSQPPTCKASGVASPKQNAPRIEDAKSQTASAPRNRTLDVEVLKRPR